MNYSEDEVNSCHTRRLRRLSIEDMDPSMLIAFLVRDRNDWNSWRNSINQVSGKAVVHIADKEPILHSHDIEPQSVVDDVEILDEDENEDELEMVDHPT